jgi:hypothetical protein
MKTSIRIFLVLPIVLSWMLSLDCQRVFSEQRPRFEDYQTEKIYKGPVAPVNLSSHRQARMFRTKLREGASAGPNFAGHYTVVKWGCGTECVQIAIVDAKSGEVCFPLRRAGISYDYRNDSNLLVVNPPKDMEEAYGSNRPSYTASEYYLWEHNRLRIIFKEKLPKLPETKN